MVETLEKADVRELTLAPKSPLLYSQQLKAVQPFHTGLGDSWLQCGSPTPQTVVLQVAGSWR
jgi:hypothetical protein